MSGPVSIAEPVPRGARQEAEDNVVNQTPYPHRAGASP